MKGDKFNYVIPLERAFMFPPKKRIRKALNEILRFVKKHARPKTTLVATEVNEYLHKNSKNIPRRVNATLYREDDKVTVYLETGKQLEAYLKKKEAEKKHKDKEKKEKTKEAAEKTEIKEEDKEKAKKLEEKKEKEKAARASEIKRKAK
ncbi:MAG: hypothetical protein COV47_02525 [Candidatus Diapherotrites archaeon CG11_big_fil_rev_8_21_14_0_20_37_9]|nr:MAG: hypothetical protein COV47_02525 [Candidatus Diapherotrites archaeon CG11_big_fil_rev_8_21_14_0_20_37_9]